MAEWRDNEGGGPAGGGCAGAGGGGACDFKADLSGEGDEEGFVDIDNCC